MSQSGEFHAARLTAGGAEHVTTDYGSARITPSGLLHNVTVHHQYRGKGHGHELMKKVTATADRARMPLYLEAREELHPFYAKHGFVPTQEKVGLGSLPAMKRDPR